MAGPTRRIGCTLSGHSGRRLPQPPAPCARARAASIRKLDGTSWRDLLSANQIEAVAQLVGPTPHHALGSCPVGDAARTLPVQTWVHLSVDDAREDRIR